jgi:hypothetical protein
MATKTDLTGKVRVLAEFFDGDAAAQSTADFAVAPTTFEWMFPIACGTSDGQANIMYARKGLTIAASATTTFDLAGVLTDLYGHTLTFTNVKLIVLKNRSVTAGDTLHIGPAATTGWVGFWADASDRSLCKAGIAGQPGFLVLYDPVGIAVTAGTADDLVIIETGAANTITYDLLIVGEGTYA